MKLAVRLLTLALCAFCIWQMSVIDKLRSRSSFDCPDRIHIECAKPLNHCSPEFHDGICFDGPFDPAKIPPVVPQSRIWIEPLTIGGVGLPACPSNKKCV